MMEQIRDPHHESTYVNSAVAGAVTGAVMASMTKRFDMMSTSALGFGILMGMIEYNGQTFQQTTAIKPEWISQIAPGEMESNIVKGLKEKYPEFKNL